MKFFLFACFYLLSGWIVLNAQKQEQKRPRYAITVEPLYLHNGGLKLNLEKQLKQKETLELSLVAYFLPYRKIESYYFLFWGGKEGGYITPSSEFQRFNKLSGCGIGGAYKRYFSKFGVLSAGMSYTYSDIQYPHLGFHKYKEDGLTFYEYDLREVHQNFNTFAANLSAGIHSSFHNLIFVECTLGLGYAYSLYDKDKRAFNNYALGLGYRGIYPALSVKLGFNI
jgi:hypothetical protein